MGVYIPNMEMPENCQDCTFCDFETDYEESGYYVCHAIPKQIIPTYTERNDDCPLVPVPPHGQDCRTCVQDCQFIGCYMPNILGCSGYIPAEEDET